MLFSDVGIRIIIIIIVVGGVLVMLLIIIIKLPDANEGMSGMNQFTEVKVFHSGTVQYIRTDVRADQQGAAAVNAFQRQVRGTYITNMKEKDR